MLLAYEYAHAGLFVLCSSSYETVIEYLEEGCSPVNDYDDLVPKLAYFKDNLEELYNRRQRIFEFARQNLARENYDQIKSILTN
jgi:glycosyltransferase involved in cell wall biosynthesis